MSIIDIAKRIAENPLVRHGEAGPWTCIYDPDSVTVARELSRLLDDTPADREWAGLAWPELVVHRRASGELEFFYRQPDGGDLAFVGLNLSRGQVRCLAITLGVELKEGE